jgi:uncharacterized membrane protein YfcA
VTPIDIAAAAILWPATLVGGYAGARMARRLPEAAFRLIVIAICLAGAVHLLVR